MKVYIAGPITGVKDYEKRFQEAREYLEERGLDVINPAALDKVLPKDTTHEGYMRVCLQLLADCDAIYLLDGWQQSRGANRECGYALAKDMIILDDTIKL